MNKTCKHVNDSNKRDAISWKEPQFLDKKTPTRDHYCPHLEVRDEFDLCKILVKFKK